MSLVTADQIRQRRILVPVPSTDGHIACQIPDPLVLIANGMLPLEQFHAVLAKFTDVTEQDDPRPDLASAEPRAYVEFLDRWACAAAVSPRVVLTEEEATTDPTALWVTDLDLSVKAEILQRTNQRLVSVRLSAAVRSFRAGLAPGPAAGPNGTAVRDDALPAAAGA